MQLFQKVDDLLIVEQGQWRKNMQLDSQLQETTLFQTPQAVNSTFAIRILFFKCNNAIIINVHLFEHVFDVFNFFIGKEISNNLENRQL